MTGKVNYWQGSVFGIHSIVEFYKHLHESYPSAETIYLIQDNWPIHSHPDVLAALEEQQSPFHRYVPESWPKEASAKALKKYGTYNLPIQLVQLPTYAPWTNPIEKFWRKLRQEIIHLHRLADDLPELRKRVIRWLEQYADGSDSLLEYVGLLIPV